jgi:hypothetical protein
MIAAPLLASLLPSSVHATAFSHPAGWHTAADIVRVRSFLASGKEPWCSAAQLLLNDTSLAADYSPSPPTGSGGIVCRTCCSVSCCPPNASAADPCHHASSGGMERDGIAAYYLMLRWVATGDAAWADAAMRVLDAWSESLTGFAGHDQMLAVGLYGGHMAQAAELLAHAKPGNGGSGGGDDGGDGWALKGRAQAMFREVIHPACSDFCGRTNDGWPQPPPQDCAHGANGNWDAVCMSGVASWAVFLDNATMLASVSEYYRNGAGNGRLVNYVIDAQGECQESGRDQGHTQLGLLNLLQAAFTVYHATNDSSLLTMEGQRLCAGLEYTARYNLGHDVNYTSNCGVAGHMCAWKGGGCTEGSPPGLPAPRGQGWCYQAGPSNQSRGEFAPMWEMAAGVYGAAVPHVQQLLAAPGYRPESGRGGPVIHGGAHVGDGAPRFGTLMFFGMQGLPDGALEA